MGHQRLRFVGVACLKRLFGLPVHLEDEIALDDKTAVDTWMSVTARASARRELHNRSHGPIPGWKIDGMKDVRLMPAGCAMADPTTASPIKHTTALTLIITFASWLGAVELLRSWHSDHVIR